MKKIFFLVPALTLAACTNGASSADQEADMSKVQATLPDGCSLHYAGEVRVEGRSRPSRIFYTVCNGVTTTSETHAYKQGKKTVDLNTVAITK